MIGIVILNYINWKDTANCIDSINASGLNINYHIYVVDNASPIEPDEEVKLKFEVGNITYIKNKENKGYSYGNNVGIRRAISDGCDKILITNSDIVFKRNSISTMSEYLDEHKSVGIVGPKVYLPSGGVQEINMGVRTGLKEKYMFILRKSIFKHFIKEFLIAFTCINQDLSKPFKVHAVSGCCFMMSEECVKEITPFDENVFLYQEELIIGIAMEDKGFETVYLTDSEVTHFHSQSTKHIRAFAYSCLVESEIYYFRRYLGTNSIKLLPLYLIRLFKYLFLATKDDDYRKNFILFWNKTMYQLLRNTIR